MPEKLRHLESDQCVHEKYGTVHQAAKVLQSGVHWCKGQRQEEQSIDRFFSAANKLAPDALFNLMSKLLHYKVLELHENWRVITDQATMENSLIISRALLQHVSGILTPLGVAASYHVFNQTCSKSLITLNNRLGQRITYGHLRHPLAAQSVTIMQHVEEDGIYIPEHMSPNCQTLQVFTMDSLDWKKKGGSFHATTAITVESPEECVNRTSVEKDVSVRLSATTSARSTTFSDVIDPTVCMCHISTKVHQRSSLNLTPLAVLRTWETPWDNIAEGLLVPVVSREKGKNLTAPAHATRGWSSSLGFLLSVHGSTSVEKPAAFGYLPLIPALPTDPAVLKDQMAWLVMARGALGWSSYLWACSHYQG